MVFVLHKNGSFLMPTKNHAKVRVLLKTNRARVVNIVPFTIQLLYDTTNMVEKESSVWSPSELIRIREFQKNLKESTSISC